MVRVGRVCVGLGKRESRLRMEEGMERRVGSQDQKAFRKGWEMQRGGAPGGYVGLKHGDTMSAMAT